MKTVTIKLPESEIERLDHYIALKKYPSKSEFIRNLIREKLDAEFEQEIVEACKVIVKLEDKFIELAFSLGDIEHLSVRDLKRYIRYIADFRLVQLEMTPIYNITVNPLPWLEGVLNNIEHANFFENKSTEYSRASTKGSWDDIIFS